jgi:hypothetical protein
MNYEDAKQYFEKLAQDSGLDGDAQSAVLQALENEKFARGVADGFIRHDEYSRGMDKVRSREEELNKWYNDAAMPAYQTNVRGIEKLRQYETLYGDLTNGSSPASSSPSTPNREELDRYLEDKFRARDQAYTGLSKTISKITFDYYKRFGEPLDVDEVEKIALSRGMDPMSAYKEYISPKLEAQQKTEVDAKLKAARDEGYRDALTKHRLPVDTAPKDYNPFFDREVPKTGTSEVEADRASRSAFLEGWGNYTDELANKKTS